MKDILLILISIIIILIALFLIYNGIDSFFKEFERNCYEQIEKRDKELEEEKKLNNSLRKWLFKKNS